MAKTKTPKLAEAIDVLLNQMEDFKKTVDGQKSTLANFKVEVDVGPLRELELYIEKKRRENFDAFQSSLSNELSDLKTLMNNFIDRSRTQHQEITKIQKFIKSRALIYFTLIFLFLISLAGFASYYAGKNYNAKSNLEQLENERDQLLQKESLFYEYLKDNQNIDADFKNWYSKKYFQTNN